MIYLLNLKIRKQNKIYMPVSLPDVYLFSVFLHFPIDVISLCKGVSVPFLSTSKERQE